MRFKSFLFAVCTLAVGPLAVACIDVTCAERGTCAPGETTEPPADAAVSKPVQTPDGAASSAAVEVDGSLTNGGESTSSAGCITSCAPPDAAAPTSLPLSDAATGYSGSGFGVGSDAAIISGDYSSSTDAETCVEICDCDSGACSSSVEPVDAGPRVCSEAEAAACIAPASICVWENDAPLCIECRTSEDCGAPAGVCIANHCEVCDFASNDGCSLETPFCVAVGAAAIDGGTSPGGDASAPSGSADAGSATPTRECVECRNGNDCGSEAPLCSAGSCVQCVADTDCTNPDEPRCDTATNSCTGCNAVGQCSRFDGTSACNLNDGKCVECTAAESEACEEFACQTTPGAGQYRCSEQELGLGEACGTCVSDAACGDGLACVFESFAEQDTEWVCLPKKPDDGCTRPLIGLLEEATSADSQVIEAFCKPANTTCASFRHYGSGGFEGEDPCEVDDDCGLPGVADGLCVPYPNTSLKLCSYSCLVNFECPSPSQCVQPNSVRYCSVAN
jgi:hypothetical protein